MYQEIIKNIRPNLDKVIDKLKQEIAVLRTGQASPALLENIMVDCYNSRMPLKQLAAINMQDSRSLVVQPWDKTIIKDIEKAIASAGSGLSSAVDGDLIRVSLPAASEETRKEMVKLLHNKLEEARIAVRVGRDGAWKTIQEMTRDGKIREDDKFRGKDELQKVIDEYNGKIKELGDKKERDILAV